MKMKPIACAKRLTAWMAVLGILIGGCGPTKEAMDAYYQQLQLSNQAIINSLDRQADENRKARTEQRVHFARAMAQAAATPSQTDDVVISYAWGYQSGQPMPVTIPEIETPRAPETASEQLRAWTPIIGMAVPFLYPLAYGWSSGSGGTKYSATDNARITVGSQNAGSYNKAGRDAISTTTDQQNGDDICTDCLEDEIITPDATCTGAPAPVFGRQETWWIDASQTCSCESFQAGRCGPA